jgi:hypothetical protein
MRLRLGLDLRSEAPRLQGGASGKCSYDYTVGFDSSAGVRCRPPRPKRLCRN